VSAKRSALGRGLGALIPGGSDARNADTTSEAKTPASREQAPGSSASPAVMPTPRDVENPPGPLQIAVERIRPNPDQPRRVFDPAHLKELSESIVRHGVLQPVVVRYAGDGDYELIVGERRWRA
jgi:ParB family chromosome partitioning protein